MTVIPVSMESWELLRWNSLPSSGNMGAMDRAPVTEIQVKSHWLAMTITRESEIGAFSVLHGSKTYVSNVLPSSGDLKHLAMVWAPVPSSPYHPHA